MLKLSERTRASAGTVAWARLSALAALAVFALSIPVAAQVAGEAPDLLTYVPDGQAMDAAQRDQLAAYEADPTTAEVNIVRINPETLRTADAITLNIEGVAPVVLDEVRIEQRSETDFSWLAQAAPGGSSPLAQVTLVVSGADIVGTIRIGDELYRLRPAGDAQALIRVDQSAFPEEHPPEFEEMERRSSLDVPRPLMLPAADTCKPYTAIVAYTATAKAQAGNIDALIQLAIDETNQGYSNSQVGTGISLVHKYQTAYAESGDMTTDRDRFRIPGDGFMDEVHSLRTTHQADVAILITGNGNYCGIASAIMADASTAFAVVGQNCATGYYSFAHEIGHLQGARHNPEADPTNTPFAYGHGYYSIPNGWRTIMSYACSGGSCTRLNYWSNPGVTYGGVAMGTAAANDNRRVLNETSCTIAGFSGPPAGASGPLAFGVIWSNGSKMSGTPNWTSTYNSTLKRFEITISGQNYYYSQYATAVTAAGDIRYCRTDSVAGKLLIYCYDAAGAGAPSRIAFVTYRQ